MKRHQVTRRTKSGKTITFWRGDASVAKRPAKRVKKITIDREGNVRYPKIKINTKYKIGDELKKRKFKIKPADNNGWSKVTYK